jgi:aspartyl-tRNA(Asn)/glutamyl-tRNA(Gln) amidotransferase subunit C
MKIDRAEARRIAELAHLEFDDASLDRMAGEMTEILGYIETLREAESGGETPSPAGTDAMPPLQATPMREDFVHPSLKREVVETNAPAWSNGFFVVPKVIE